ncbi:family 16 glycosylhydrolase [Pedobacter frigoris]|uniref:Glycosyl hydrolase family protein n=1 Tax=Pedobacter frigoris TaxID=2571272 RepID=A0A4U1CRI5_9SPHI|nr:family 16 glycosylhydrolase [Pedobacter frigoris]TKC09540.1 glycosyl hydrolase family protein [Pedobacter frigoris]
MKKNPLNCKNVIMLLFTTLVITSCTKQGLQPEQQLTERDKPETISATNNVALLSTPVYQLIWADEFNTSGSFNANNWQYSPRGTVAWNKYMTATPTYASQNGTNLVLRMDNATIAGDAVPYHSGGVQSNGKFNVKYGKIEVRAKFTLGQGSWPAIWMMPDSPVQYGGWPNSGEIDIMEHVNNETVMHQTIHNASVTNANGGSTATHSASYTQADYNTYAIEWSPVSIKFFVNNILQYTYSKAVGANWQQWPFDAPFYLILNQAGGAGWPGPITNSNLPFSMQVDYVRVYKLSQVENGGFEGASLSPWTSWGSTVSIVTGNARSGTKSIKQTGAQSSVEQVITGLTPNTAYRFAGYAKVSAAGESVSIGVKSYGGTQVGYSINTTYYSLGGVNFTTGATNTSATVYFYKAASGTVYGDDFYLEKQ